MKNWGFWSIFLGLGMVLTSSVGEAQVVREIHLNPTLTPKDDPFYELGKVRITARKIKSSKVESRVLGGLHDEFVKEVNSCAALKNEQTEDPMSIANWVLKAWDIIQDNKAVLNVETENVKALPVLAKDHWEQLTGWRPEHGVEFSLQLENLYGITVVDLKYDVRLIYGGSVKKVGKYIASARIVPRHIEVLWGFGLDVRAKEVAVQNLGTAKNPFASISIDVTLNYGSIMKRMAETLSYRLDADGVIRDLTNGTAFFTRTP